MFNSCELVSLVTAIACNMANCYSQEDLSLLAAIFTQLGDTLETILTNEELNEACHKDNFNKNVSKYSKDNNHDDNDDDFENDKDN